MRRTMLLFVLLALMVSPAAAQQPRSVLDVLAADAEGRFTAFITAMEAAEVLTSGDAPYTVFAPTNDAFEAALRELGTTQEGLLADRDLLEALAGYHVVAGQAYRTAELNGAALETVQGEGLVIAANGSGQLFINGAAAVQSVDLAAENGIVHTIDRALIPEALRVQDGAATPQMAHIRFAHLSPDTPPLDLLLDGELSSVSGLAYREVSGWYTLPVGSYAFEAVPTGGSAAQAFAQLPGADLPLASWQTVALVGTRERGTLKLVSVLEDYSPISDGRARVTVFHALDEFPEIDVTANGDLIVQQLAFPGARGRNDGAFVVEVPADVYDLQIIISGTAFRGRQAQAQAPSGEATAEPTLGPWVVVDLPESTLAANSSYFLGLTGTDSQPEGVLVGTETLTSPPSPLSTRGEGESESAGTIADVLRGTTDLSTARAAVEAAGLIDLLAGERPFTVFAPTNAAFEVALEEFGITQEAMLGDVEGIGAMARFHIAEGEWTAAQVGQLTEIPTLAGIGIPVLVSSDGTAILDARAVMVRDIRATNGIVHVIDAVLLPE